ncbi:MAG: DNA mismatch repair endonuclease MutL [Armatimonadetes bacterium]|nr:DNA mismatch repair endonuclease MutL [Armatimonadota bacterium]
MPRIAVLDRSVSERIAAGEVIERPSSVVKELVENSLDAGSDWIRVEIRDGGKQAIIVSDNGCGMSEQDAVLALARHATSKIQTLDDLDTLLSLGFRGEAIPSIASVSRMEIWTKEHGGDGGTRVQIEGGEILDVSPTGCPSGTRIVVEDLFWNLPARRKFLRSPLTEQGHVADLVGKMALSNPAVHWLLVSKDRTLADLPPGTDLSGRVAQVMGKVRPHELIPVSGGGFFALSGVVSIPTKTWPNRRNQVFFVNGRLVHSPILAGAVSEGLARYFPQPSQHPMVVLFVQSPPGEVDVNVHPTKSEVRFSRPGDVYREVATALQESLEAGGLNLVERAYSIPANTAFFSPPPAPPTRGGEETGWSAGRGEEIGEDAGGCRQAGEGARIGEETDRRPWGGTAPQQMVMELPAAYAAAPGGQILGQLGGTYILVREGDTLFFLDQHNIHERIHFEALNRRRESRKSLSQGLLFPLHLDVGPKEAAFLAEKLPLLRDVGFDLESFGLNRVLVRAVPFGFEKLAGPDQIRDLLTEISARDDLRDPTLFLEHATATVACKAALKAGEVLSEDEMLCLWDGAKSLANPSVCPHGRPVMIQLRLEDLHRMFKRK